MKLLIVSFTFPPQVGGVAEVARTQACGFSKRGHEVTVVTEFDPSRDKECLTNGIDVRQFRIGSSLGQHSGGQDEIEAYRQFLQSHPSDVILFQCWQNRATDLAVPILPLLKARKVMVSHGFDAHLWRVHPRPFWGLGEWLRSQPYVWRLPRMMKAFDDLVFLSDRRDAGRFLDRWVAQYALPSRVSIIPNGVYLSEFKREHGDFRKAYGIETKHILLNVANYCDRKNQLSTLRDFTKANLPDASLVFIGAEFNEYSSSLSRVFEQNRGRFPHARVVILEKVPKPMIYAAYQAADLFILGAKFETQPLAILDAMAAGIPFISSNAGCVSEFPGGMVVRRGPDTTRAICWLLQDVALRQKLGAEGRAACEMKYDWERVLGKFEDLFGRLTMRSRSES